MGAHHSTCRPETGMFRAIFIAPTELRMGYVPPFNRVLAEPWGLRAIFIAPTELKVFYVPPFIGGRAAAMAYLFSLILTQKCK